ncbi:universal stress protein [Kocuria rhizophila]|nr:universal stress protein [Kocuria rhizophila]
MRSPSRLGAGATSRSGRRVCRSRTTRSWAGRGACLRAGLRAAELVVVGSRRGRRVHRPAHGLVPGRADRRRRTVMVVPASAEPAPARSLPDRDEQVQPVTPDIVVAYDGSDHSERALDWAIAESQQRQLPGEDRALRGRQTRAGPVPLGAFAEALQEESEKLAKHAVEKARTAGVTAQGIISAATPPGSSSTRRGRRHGGHGQAQPPGCAGRGGLGLAAVASHAKARWSSSESWDPEARVPSRG